MDTRTERRGWFSPSNNGSLTVKRSSKNRVLLIFVWLVFLCCAINLRLHSNATAGAVIGGQSRKYIELGDGAVDRVVAAVGGQKNGTKASTWSPTTWNPTTRTRSSTTQNQTSPVPTGLISTIDPTTTKSLNAQKYENGRLYDDERSLAHPRVACFIHDDVDNDLTPNENNMKLEAIKQGNSCSAVPNIYPRIKRSQPIPSIPLEEKPGGGKDDTENRTDTDDENEYDPNEYGENDTCKYPDPSHRATSTAPPTCNDIHSLGFDPGMFENRHHLSIRSPGKYITAGGMKCIWKFTTLNDKYGEETVILKSQKNAQHYKERFWDLSNKDALIAGGMGNSQLSRVVQSQNSIPPSNHSSWNHIVPMYNYCALANIVPYAAGGNLEEYIPKIVKGKRKPRKLGPTDTLRVALQAARGLYQAHLYWDGRPTFVHADLNPSQFLVFIPHSHNNKNESAKHKLPILQINDFNQGRFLTRSINNNETCPFRSCTKNQRGSRYHTPERFIYCLDMDDRVDTFSLGGVFFYLLTNGFVPYYDKRNYGDAIKGGDLPHIPSSLHLDHPAYNALKDVMIKCLAFKLRDRPSSLEVVQMLEEKMEQIGMQLDI